jgi:hypothetical protein
MPFQTENGKRKPRPEKRKWKKEAQASFLNPFCSLSMCKRKFAICLFADEEKIGRYPFANEQNRLNRLNGLAYL